MERRLKERITGAFVLMLLAIIFIPMILDNSAQEDARITGTNIPPAPDVEFRSSVVPVDELPPVPPPALSVEPLPDTAGPVQTLENGSTAAMELSPAPGPAPAVTETAGNDPVPAIPGQPDTELTPTTETAAPATDTSSRSLSAWVIQLGSFSSQVNAEGLVRRLQSNGFPAYIEPVKSETETVYKVRVGPELSRTEAETVQKNLKSRMNLDAIILRFP